MGGEGVGGWRGDSVCGDEVVCVEMGWCVWRGGGVCGEGVVCVERGWCVCVGGEGVVCVERGWCVCVGGEGVWVEGTMWVKEVISPVTDRLLHAQL